MKTIELIDYSGKGVIINLEAAHFIEKEVLEDANEIRLTFHFGVEIYDFTIQKEKGEKMYEEIKELMQQVTGKLPAS